MAFSLKKNRIFTLFKVSFCIIYITTESDIRLTKTFILKQLVLTEFKLHCLSTFLLSLE